jgi:hypothetical protein
MKIRAFAVLFSVFASACTTTGGEPLPDWPELAIVEHHVSHREMRERCAKYAPPMMTPEACAEFYFVQGECHIWFSADFPPSEAIVRHEREHCRGYEHAGESGLREMLATYRASQASASTGASAPGGGAAPLLRGERASASGGF